MQFEPIFEIFFILASGADTILLIFIAGSNRNGSQTKKCWFAFLGLIIETPTKRPANEFDSTVSCHIISPCTVAHQLKPVIKENIFYIATPKW